MSASRKVEGMRDAACGVQRRIAARRMSSLILERIETKLDHFAEIQASYN
jgi:hypothetical protein